MTLFFPIDSSCPKTVIRAVQLIFICIALTFVSSSVDFLFFEQTAGGYLFEMVCTALYLLFPYKILRASDFARFLFVMLEGVSVLLYFTSDFQMQAFATISTYVQIPIIGTIIYFLFSKDSNSWFANNNKS